MSIIPKETVDQLNLKDKIQKTKEKFKKYQLKYIQLLAKCKHISVVNENDSAVCFICGQDLGWWCEMSPKKFCNYNDNTEDCIYCGGPEERK